MADQTPPGKPGSGRQRNIGVGIALGASRRGNGRQDRE